MITGEQANQLCERGSVQEQLDKLDEVIRKVAPQKKRLVLAISGYVEEWMAEQEKLWPNFQGIDPETMKICEKNHIYIHECNDRQGHSWVITW